VSSCLQSSNVTTNKSSCKQLFDNHEDSQSPILKESNPGKYSLDISMEKVDCISILKDLNKQNSKSEYLTEMKLPKIVCMSDSMPEITSDSYSMTDKIIINTPNWSQKEIPHDKTDTVISNTPNWSQKEIPHDQTDKIISNTPNWSQKEISHDKTDTVISNTPNWSQKEIPHDKTDTVISNTLNLSQKEIPIDKTDNVPSISLMYNVENKSYTNVYESFEPWSIHRTPAKLRGMYTWSPFFKTK